jgi:D-amino peptidase
MPSAQHGKRFYISADLEGVCGVTSARQVFPSSTDDKTGYHRAVAQLGHEVSAVIKGLAQAGPISEIVVNDSHAGMSNVWLDHLPPTIPVSLLSGKPKPVAMMSGLDSRFDGAFLIGYHAKAGTQQAILCHSFTEAVADLRLNGLSLGEAGLNTAYAWLTHGVPVLMASGDDALAAELSEFAPAIETVVTKEALGWSAALNYPVEQVLSVLESAAHRAAMACPAPNGKPMAFSIPKAIASASEFELDIQLTHPQMVDIVQLLPGCQRLDGVTLRLRQSTLPGIYLAFQALYSLIAYQKTL